MNVVYFAIGQEFAAQAELAAEALRMTNPEAKAWVLTDKTTEFKTLVPFRMHSSPATLIYDRTIMQFRFLREHGYALFLDSDCVVNRPLQDVFSAPITLTKRVPPKAVPEQIYNGGVLYGEGKPALKFWLEWVDLYQQIDRGAWAWWGDQMILPILVPHHPVTVLESQEQYNHIPTRLDQLGEVLPATIVHFKGNQRKSWMPVYVETLRAHHGTTETV